MKKEDWRLKKKKKGERAKYIKGSDRERERDRKVKKKIKKRNRGLWERLSSKYIHIQI
jgi:hypothetical protein